MLAAFYRLVRRVCPPDARDDGVDMAAITALCIDARRRRYVTPGVVWACAFVAVDPLLFILATHHHHRARVRRMRESGAQPPRKGPSMLTRDVRAAFHQFRHRPAFTAAVVLMFAVGIGATTTIFSVVYGVLLRPLPYPAAGRLVQAVGSVPCRGIPQANSSEANFWDVRDLNRTFAAFGAEEDAAFTLTGDGPPERIQGSRVTVGFLRALGVVSIAGRAFQPGDDDPAAPPGLRAAVGQSFLTQGPEKA